MISSVKMLSGYKLCNVSDKVRRRSYAGQAGVENVTFLAAVLLIAVVALALLAYFFTTSTDAKMSQSDTYWQAQATPIAIVSDALTNDGVLAMTLESKSTKNVEVIAANVVGNGLSASDNGSLGINPGQRGVVYVSLGNNTHCTPGQVYELWVNFTYHGEAGDAFDKKESGSLPLILRCGGSTPIISGSGDFGPEDCGRLGNGTLGLARNGAPCSNPNNCSCHHCYDNICRQCLGNGHCYIGWQCINYQCIKCDGDPGHCGGNGG